MSSTDTLSQPRPFDRLPNELLAATLAYLDTPIRRDSSFFSSAFDAPTDRSRRRTLRAVCLVSKRFHADGRRLLCGQLKVSRRNHDEVLSALRESAAQARVCRILVLEGWISSFFAPLDTDGWFQLLPGVEDLTLAHSPRVDLAAVATLCNLRRLHLHDVRLVLGPRLCTLPHLASIILDDTVIQLDGSSPPDWAETIWPTARHVALVRCPMADDDGTSWTRRRPLSCAFLEQLACLTLNLLDMDYLARGALDLDSLGAHLPILWAVELYEDYDAPSSSGVPLTYILGMATDVPLDEEEASPPVGPRWRLEPFVRLRRILAEQRAPRLVLLPPLLWAHGDALDPDVAREWQGVVDECARRGIALRKHDPAREYDGVVPEFMEFLREEAAGRRS